jgi:hypothetical protein
LNLLLLPEPPLLSDPPLARVAQPSLLSGLPLLPEPSLARVVWVARMMLPLPVQAQVPVPV